VFVALSRFRHLAERAIAMRFERLQPELRHDLQGSIEMRFGLGRPAVAKVDLAERAKRIGFVGVFVVRSRQLERTRSGRKRIFDAADRKVSLADICETERMSRGKSPGLGHADTVF